MAAQESTDVRTLKMAVVLYVAIFALKLATYYVTGVMALLGEALHTLSDIFIYGFLLVAAVYSRKPADEVHMFGYGRAQNVAALVAATLFISFTSYKLYEEAIPRLFAPSKTGYQNLGLALGAIVVSMLIAAAPLVSVLRQERRGAAAKAQLISLLNDELGLAAALIGTLFVALGQPLADPIATIVVATVIAWSAIGLFRENRSFLLGRSPGAEYLANVERQARSVEGVLGVHDLRAEYIGPDTVHAGLHVEVRPDLTIAEADRIGDEVTSRIHEAADSGYCVIHLEPATEGPSSDATQPVLAATRG